MNDYCIGIAYATGSFVQENGKNYLVVRNSDKWYPDCIAKESGYNVYQSKYPEKIDKPAQWIIKARNIDYLPKLTELSNANDFCRSYIEIHGVLDIARLRKRGKIRYYLRLRIYGKEYILNYINTVLPAKEKKMQYIRNVGGSTYALYYQSCKEIIDIFNWIDGNMKNEKVWNNWKNVIDEWRDKNE